MPKFSNPPSAVSLDLERLKSLPVRPDVWQLGMVRFPSWVTGEGGEPFRPLVALCLSGEHGLVGDGDACAPGDPVGPPALAAVARLAAMKEVRYRPERIVVCDPSLANSVRTVLADCGIELEIVERLEDLDRVFADMMRQVAGPSASLRLYPPGLEVARIRAFAEAAAEFYRAAPWNHLGDDDLIEVESPAASEGLGCLTVLGAGGIERGLGFYASRSAFERFAESGVEGPQVAAAGMWLLGFDDITDWPFADADLWEQHALPVAGAVAYPSLVCHLPSGREKPADAEQLAFAEALLRALSASTEDELDAGRWRKTVSTFDGPCVVELALPAIVDAKPRARAGGPRPPGEVPDRRVMEQTLRDLKALLSSHEFGSAEEANAFLAGQVGKRPPHEPARTPQGRAQELLDRAFEESGRLQVKLAREAVALWPDSADGWALQAENMPDLARRRELYRKAVEAGERALGPRPFAEDMGHFWGMLETRPYMRARAGLAGASWEAGDQDEAIGHWLEMLRLNPGDNQGIRLELVPRLLEAHRDADAERVLAEFVEDRSAVLAYGAALLEFRLSGASPAAQARLDAAMRANPHVPKYLAGRSKLGWPLPEEYRPGADDEARLATALLLEAWNATDGAVAWLGHALRPPKSERRARRGAVKGKKRR